jgi:hypothetical protein
MPDHENIYRREADQYEYLVACEDYNGNLLPAIQRILPLTGMDKVELGAGTGRLTCLLAPLVRSMRAYDVSQPLLDVAIGKLKDLGLANCKVEIADHRQLPLPANQPTWPSQPGASATWSTGTATPGLARSKKPWTKCGACCALKARSS